VTREWSDPFEIAERDREIAATREPLAQLESEKSKLEARPTTLCSGGHGRLAGLSGGGRGAALARIQAIGQLHQAMSTPNKREVRLWHKADMTAALREKPTLRSAVPNQFISCSNFRASPSKA
jgi:hypothetical protein